MTTALETVLAQAHALSGEPHSRLSQALAVLEGADWGQLYAHEEALAAQLARLIGPGLVRFDPRLPLNRELYAARGLALASLDGDWQGARAVWLLEPDEAALGRARRLDVPVIVDATLSPGGRWLEQGAELVTYRDPATLTGFGDLQLAALLGLGERPARAAPAPADLASSLALRDLSTLALRMNRRARNGEALHERLRGALMVAGGVLLLEGQDSLSTVTPLGGSLSAARMVSAGTLVTVGIEDTEDAWDVLSAALLDVDAGSLGLAGQRNPPAGQDEQPDAVGDPVPEPAQSVSGQPQPGQLQSGQREPDARRRESGPAVLRLGGGRPAAQPQPPQLPSPASGPATPDESVADEEAFADREFVFSSPAAPAVQDRPATPDHSATPDQAATPDQPARPDQTAEPAGPGRREERSRRGRRPRGDRSEWYPALKDTSAPPSSEESPATEPPVTEPAAGGLAAQDPSAGDPTDTPASAPSGRSTAPGDAAAQAADAAPTDPATPPAEAAEPPLLPDLPEAREAADPTEGLDEAQTAIFMRLREWRNAEAKRQSLSRFIIASNATLAEIARRIPYTEADLKAVRGMGPERLRKYGEKILEVVRG